MQSFRGYLSLNIRVIAVIASVTFIVGLSIVVLVISRAGMVSISTMSLVIGRQKGCCHGVVMMI